MPSNHTASGIPLLNPQPHREITFLDRTLATIFILRQTGCISEQIEVSFTDLRQAMTDHATANGELLDENDRDEYTEYALERLDRSQYIRVRFPDGNASDGRLKIQAAFEEVLSTLAGMIAVSDQFNSLTVFNSNQYKTLCDFFHDFTLSNRLPLANEAITEADILEAFLSDILQAYVEGLTDEEILDLCEAAQTHFLLGQQGN